MIKEYGGNKIQWERKGRGEEPRKRANLERLLPKEYYNIIPKILW
jgi:hypothetical protein